MLMKSVVELSKVTKKFQFCTETFENVNFKLGMAWEKLSNLSKTCQKPCSTTEFKGQTKTYKGWKPKNEMRFAIVLVTNEMKVHEEYIVYNEVDLVGIVGGNLGLFIGFSFFEKVKQIINFIIDKI